MDARTVVPAGTDTRPPLVCTCRLSLTRNGQPLSVVAHLWDCPSHGRDKRKTLADMCSVARPTAMWTFTLPQPRAVDDQGVIVVPPEFADCDWYQHVYEYKDGTLRWRTLSTCPLCCKRVARMMDSLTKWVRRRWPGAQRLWVREDHKSGAMHIHSAWAGVPHVGRKSANSRKIRAQWVHLGGGSQVDFGGSDGPRDGARIGWYIGKYLAKSHDRPMARGYRRWSRSRHFAPDVVMPRYKAPEDRPAGLVEILGWVDPWTLETRSTRFTFPT